MERQSDGAAWVQHYSNTHSRYYYYNASTKETSWVQPASYDAASPPTPSEAVGSGVETPSRSAQQHSKPSKSASKNAPQPFGFQQGSRSKDAVVIRKAFIDFIHESCESLKEDYARSHFLDNRQDFFDFALSIDEFLLAKMLSELKLKGYNAHDWASDRPETMDVLELRSDSEEFITEDFFNCHTKITCSNKVYNFLNQSEVQLLTTLALDSSAVGQGHMEQLKSKFAELQRNFFALEGRRQAIIDLRTYAVRIFLEMDSHGDKYLSQKLVKVMHTVKGATYVKGSAKAAAQKREQEDIEGKIALRKESFKIMQEVGVEVMVELADHSEFETRIYCSRKADLEQIDQVTCLYWFENTKNEKKRHDGKIDDAERDMVEHEMKKELDSRLAQLKKSQQNGQYTTLKRNFPHKAQDGYQERIELEQLKTTHNSCCVCCCCYNYEKKYYGLWLRDIVSVTESTEGGGGFRVQVQFLKEARPHLSFNFEGKRQMGTTFKKGLQASTDPVLFGLGCTKEERILKLVKEVEYARTAYAATVLQKQLWKGRLQAARMELELIGVPGADHNRPVDKILKSLERNYAAAQTTISDEPRVVV